MLKILNVMVTFLPQVLVHFWPCCVCALRNGGGRGFFSSSSQGPFLLRALFQVNQHLSTLAIYFLFQIFSFVFRSRCPALCAKWWVLCFIMLL